MAAAWTVADATFAVTSFIMAFKSDKKLSYHYLPLLVWTGFASTIAAYQALYNSDPVLNTQPLLD